MYLSLNMSILVGSAILQGHHKFWKPRKMYIMNSMWIDISQRV